MKYALILLNLFLVQAAQANTVWLKSGSGDATQAVCTNTLNQGEANPQGIIGVGNFNPADSQFSLTVTNPDGGTIAPTGQCQNIPTGTYTFTGTLTPQYSTLHAMRTGTGGALECQAQGNALSGASGSTTSGSYTITLTYSLTSDGCNPTTGAPITGDGQPTFSRSVTISGGVTTYTGLYHIYSASVPEPGSLALLLAGAAAAGLGLYGRRRAARGT